MAKSVKRIVVHPKLYMRVEGKVQHIPKGTEVTVSKEQCEKLGKKLADPAELKKLDTTVEGGKASEGETPEGEAVAALKAELEKAKAEAAKVTKALTGTAAKLDAAAKEIKALKAAAKK